MRWTARLRRTQLSLISLESRAVPSASALDVPAPATAPMQAPYPQIGDRVWKDLNGNGIQDPGERGVPFVQLNLYQGDKLVGTTTTDWLGNYTFNHWNVTNGTTDTSDDGLIAGTAYEIRIDGSQSALVGLRPTSPNVGTDGLKDSVAVPAPAGATIDFTMGYGAIYHNYNFGYAPAATIGSVVWADTNNNAIRDANEPGLPGVTVRLLDATGTTQVAITTTGADGSYHFTGLLPGTYVVEIPQANFASGAVLAGYSSSTGLPGQAAGPYEGDGTPDPNVGGRGVFDHGTTIDGGAVRSKPVTVLNGMLDNELVDFGFFRAGALSGRVFVDANANGQIDAQDSAGIAGIKIWVGGPAGLFATTTDSSGRYSFANLPAATYTVSEVEPTGYTNSTPTTQMASVGPTASAMVNFGETQMADLAVTLSARPAVVNPGGVLTLTYRVRNLGTMNATGVTMTALLPSSLKVLSVDATGGTFDMAAQQATIPTLAAGAEATFKVRVRATQVGHFRLTATVQGTQTELRLANNRSSYQFWVVRPGAGPAAHVSALLSSAFRH